MIPYLRIKNLISNEQIITYEMDASIAKFRCSIPISQYDIQVKFLEHYFYFECNKTKMLNDIEFNLSLIENFDLYNQIKNDAKLTNDYEIKKCFKDKNYYIKVVNGLTILFSKDKLSLEPIYIIEINNIKILFQKFFNGFERYINYE